MTNRIRIDKFSQTWQINLKIRHGHADVLCVSHSIHHPENDSVKGLGVESPALIAKILTQPNAIFDKGMEN